ncbi:LysR family transcriptional regulator [Oceanimonas doudoroffii]|uniref:LysR family transcriptional regulator n=1 Tax=Oceanimonas doudoroffii TaxID=84158 RepID=A0A233RII1_9GAMM|nr:LysR family transcriptional regulator [Oceanimonas doudoroffii]OXY83201.1 LysR family transcriptional regulator [Oceanimonas doudoroffii]
MATSKMHFTGQISDFDLRLLRVFKVVVESNSFTAAGVELNVSRSAVSASMLDLEHRLGFKLCERGRSGFSLTDAGRQIYENMQQLLDSLDTFRDQVNAIHSSLKGDLSIGITDNLITVRQMRIVNSLQRLKREAPDVKINIRMMPPNEIEKGVLNGFFHIGIVPTAREHAGLEYIPMYDEKLGLYCGEQHPLFNTPEIELTPKSILEHDTIVPAYAQPEYMQHIYRKHKIAATVSDREGAAFLLMTGCFIGYLPTHYAENWVRENSFRRLLPREFDYSIKYTAITKSGNHSDLVLNSYLTALHGTEY